MAKSKKVDLDAGVHSCDKCKNYERHVRKLHEARLEGAKRSNAPLVLNMLDRFEREMPFIDKRIKADREKGIRNY